MSKVNVIISHRMWCAQYSLSDQALYDCICILLHRVFFSLSNVTSRNEKRCSVHPAALKLNTKLPKESPILQSS